MLPTAINSHHQDSLDERLKQSRPEKAGSDAYNTLRVASPTQTKRLRFGPALGSSTASRIAFQATFTVVLQSLASWPKPSFKQLSPNEQEARC